MINLVPTQKLMVKVTIKGETSQLAQESQWQEPLDEVVDLRVEVIGDLKGKVENILLINHDFDDDNVFIEMHVCVYKE